jgi:hypothetical protein
MEGRRQTMKAVTLFDDDISLKQAIGYIYATKAEQLYKQALQCCLTTATQFNACYNSGKHVPILLLLVVKVDSSSICGV